MSDETPRQAPVEYPKKEEQVVPEKVAVSKPITSLEKQEASATATPPRIQGEAKLLKQIEATERILVPSSKDESGTEGRRKKPVECVNKAQATAKKSVLAASRNPVVQRLTSEWEDVNWDEEESG
jgi:hypothetical protein